MKGSVRLVPQCICCHCWISLLINRTHQPQAALCTYDVKLTISLRNPTEIRATISIHFLYAFLRQLAKLEEETFATKDNGAYCFYFESGQQTFNPSSLPPPCGLDFLWLLLLLLPCDQPAIISFCFFYFFSSFFLNLFSSFFLSEKNETEKRKRLVAAKKFCFKAQSNKAGKDKFRSRPWRRNKKKERIRK